MLKSKISHVLAAMLVTTFLFWQPAPADAQVPMQFTIYTFQCSPGQTTRLITQGPGPSMILNYYFDHCTLLSIETTFGPIKRM